MSWEQEDIIKAVNVSERCQRNFDLSKTIPQYDIETLEYVVKKSPSKQNERLIGLLIITNRDMMEKVYENTKTYFVGTYGVGNVFDLCSDEGNTWTQDTKICTYNSQVLANALYVFYEDVDLTTLQAGESLHAQKENAAENTKTVFTRQRGIAMGVAVGQLILSASLLGYKTGMCSAFDEMVMKKVLDLPGDKIPRVIVGVGYENVGVNRRAHPRLKNKDVPELSRNGLLEENWLYATHDKTIEVLRYE